MCGVPVPPTNFTWTRTKNALPDGNNVLCNERSTRLLISYQVPAVVRKTKPPSIPPKNPRNTALPDDPPPGIDGDDPVVIEPAPPLLLAPRKYSVGLIEGSEFQALLAEYFRG